MLIVNASRPSCSAWTPWVSRRPSTGIALVLLGRISQYMAYTCEGACSSVFESLIEMYSFVDVGQERCEVW